MDGNFITWNLLATYAGSLAMTLIVTQFTKDLGFIKKIPTQIWSYIVSLVILLFAFFFTNQLTLNTAVLTLFNAILVSLSANGGFSALNKCFPNIFYVSKN